jgi:hypothetical protein
MDASILRPCSHWAGGGLKAGHQRPPTTSERPFSRRPILPPWQPGAILKSGIGGTTLDLIIEPDAQPVPPARTIQGFGACFNELGWIALKTLPVKDRESVLRELFHPTEGARFTFCRMPSVQTISQSGPIATTISTVTSS